MLPSGHRAIRTLAVFLVLALGVAALLPLIARAAVQITGVVSTCGGPLPLVSGATVTLIDVNGIVPPATATTNGAGVYAFDQPAPATYIIRGTQSNYYPNENRTNVRFDGSLTKRIDLCLFPHGAPAKLLAVTVRDGGGSPIQGAPVAAYQSTNPTGRIQLVAQGTTGTTGVVNLSLWSASFELRASAPTFVTVEQTVDVSAVSAVNVTLTGTVELFGQVQSPSGGFLTSGGVAWLYNPLTGLRPNNLRGLPLKIDSPLGNGDGTLTLGEITAFKNWICNKGPAYGATDGFFTTNGRPHTSTAAPCGVTVSPTLPDPKGRVWINTTTPTQYKIKQAPPYIATGAKNYFVNMTMVPDTNVSVYQNYTYSVILPKRYELNTTRLVPSNAPVTTTNFTTVIIDPRVTSGTPQIQMRISLSVNGTARAKVDNPVGKFYVKNVTFTNYQAFVAGNTTLVFSANDSYDPNGHLANANFTWKFTPNPLDVRHGIDPAFNYTRAGNFTVNLKIVFVGGNVTFRNITVIVDDQHPVARIKTNRTGTGNANNTTLKVDEGILVKFDGGLSTDLAFVGQPGVILNSGYSWDFNGDHIADAVGRIVNHTFQKPGNFTVNLTVTDSVGWKSVNASLRAIVNDTKGPVAAFDILDPSNDWAVTTSPIEQKQIALNASRTKDDFNNLTALNFTWFIPGPIVGRQGLNNTFWGSNITFTWREWNNSYRIFLAVHDKGFPTGKVNYGNITRNVTVQIDPLLHADLRVDGTTLKVTPGDPEEGATVTVSINVTNKMARKWAENVVTNLSATSGGQTNHVTSQAEWFDKTGNTPFRANHSIAPGETAKIVFTGQLFGQGNKTLQVYIYDPSEPYTWLVDNKASTTVNVRQPAWQPYAIAGSVIGIIALFVFGMYARRKIKAGEWRPIRGHRKERGGGEEGEKRPRREEKEEKKRL